MLNNERVIKTVPTSKTRPPKSVPIKHFRKIKGEQTQMDIIKSIRVWVRNRNIHTAKPRDQYLKVVEEVGELAAALARTNMELIKDSIGDIVVTLVSLCETMDIDFNECVHGAYDEIKDRKGKLVDGVFIKEEK